MCNASISSVHQETKEGDSSMEASTSSPADADIQHQARRGLAIYLAVVVVLTALFDVFIVAFSPSWIKGEVILCGLSPNSKISG